MPKLKRPFSLIINHMSATSNTDFPVYRPKHPLEEAQPPSEGETKKQWKPEQLKNDNGEGQRPAPFVSTLLKMDARSALSNRDPPFFNVAIRFEDGKVTPVNALTEAEAKLPKKPTDKVFVAYDSAFGKFARHKWYPAHYNDKGEAKALYMMGPLTHLRTRWFPMTKFAWTKQQRIGTYGVKINNVPMKNAPESPAKATFWYGLSPQSYFGEDKEAENPHFTEFLAWRRHLNVWILREVALKQQMRGSAATTFKKYCKDHNNKPLEEWTDAEWFSCYDNDLNITFAPLPVKDGQPILTFETSAFFPRKAESLKPNEKPKPVQYHPIPEIAELEKQYGVEYNSLNIHLVKGTVNDKGKFCYMVPKLTELQKWEGNFLDGPAVVAAATFTPYLSNGKEKEETVGKYTLGNTIYRVGDASNPLPWKSRGDETVEAAADDPCAAEFARAAQEQAFIDNSNNVNE